MDKRKKYEKQQRGRTFFNFRGSFCAGIKVRVRSIKERRLLSGPPLQVARSDGNPSDAKDAAVSINEFVEPLRLLPGIR